MNPSNLQPGELAGGLPRNYLRACVLLLLAETPSHGYELIEGLRTLGIERADPGGLYRSLRAMEQEGLVESEWEGSSAGPARRCYTLTGAGEEALRHWGAVLGAVRGVLAGYLTRQNALERSRLDLRR